MPPQASAPPPVRAPSPWGKVIVVIIVLGALTMAGIVIYLRLGTMRMKQAAAEERQAIEAKIKDDTATIEDLRKLQALCVRIGDAACIDRATALLNKRTEPGGQK